MLKYLRRTGIVIFFLIIFNILPCSYIVINATDSYYNVEYQDTGCGISAAPITSYLSYNGDEMMTVQGGDSKDVIVKYYNSDYKLISSRVIARELDLFGGFYETNDYYFILTGQKNSQCSDYTECYRITKYDKEWNKISDADISGTNTVIPFYCGSVRFAENYNYLYMVTSHLRYDGHQANISLRLNMKTMTIDVVGECYVAHSLNQFIQIENDTVTTLDLGDAYPSALVLCRHDMLSFWDSFAMGTPVPDIYSADGTCEFAEIYTYSRNETVPISAGALELTDYSYLVTGIKYDYIDDYGTGNIFMASISKDDMSVKTNYITSYKSGDCYTATPHLVRVSDEYFILIWARYDDDTVRYTLINEQGQKVGNEYSIEGDLSDCVPIIVNNKVIWFVVDGTEVKFYEIDIETMDASSHSEKPAADASGVCSNCGNIAWELDGTTLTISKVKGASIGDMCNYCRQNWNPYNTTVESVVIKEGITDIGMFAFYEFGNLKSISIPAGVTEIKDLSFYGCKSLTSITIPNGVTSIGTTVFSNCTSLKKVSLPKSITSIGHMTFENCTSLTSITIPNSVTNIGNYAFLASGLTGITIPNSVTSIGNNAFQACSNLTSITIPNSVTDIGEYAFRECTGLTDITIPNSVTSIGNYAYYYCTSIKTATIPCRLKAQITANSVFPHSNPTIIWNHILPTYNVNDTTDTLSLSCASCGKTHTATLKAPTKTAYTGKPIEATCTGTSADFAPTITYSGNKLVNGKPVYPGSYTATLTYGDKKVSLKYTITEAPAPAKPNKITNVVSGVHVYWPAVSGVSKYGLWRSETGVNGTYKWIANPTVAHFTDTKVTSGKTYYYKVTTLDTVNNVHSAKSAAIGITYVATPDIKTRENKAAGIVLTWDKIAGATGYAIYRKPYSGNSDWVRVGTIDSPNTLTWTDTSVKANNGTIYKYTIRALAGANRKTLSGCRPQGRTMVRLTSRTLSSATKATATSIKCSWSTTSQATGYEVRFMVGSTVYKTFTVGNYKTGVKTFTGLKAGQTYKIQVRAYKKVEDVGTLYSAWSTPKTVSL